MQRVQALEVSIVRRQIVALDNAALDVVTVAELLT
jgi:hypothetical protein